MTIDTVLFVLILIGFYAPIVWEEWKSNRKGPGK